MLDTLAAGPESATVAELTGWPIQRAPLVPGRVSQARILAQATLARHRASNTRLEAMPAVAQELLAYAQQSSISLVDFVAMAQREPAIVGELVRVANSIMYRGETTINSVKDAVVRMGFDEAKRVVTAVASRSLFRARSAKLYSMRPVLWDELSHHGLCSAYGAAWLARKLHVGDAGIAFMAGLFHQVGKTLALHVLLPMLGTSEVPFQVDDETCRLVLDLVNDEMGSEQLLFYRMPPEVIGVCLHDPEPELPDEPRFALHHVVRLVSALLELEVRTTEAPHLAARVSRAMSALKLPTEATTRLYQEMQALSDKVAIILDQPVRPRSH